MVTAARNLQAASGLATDGLATVRAHRSSGRRRSSAGIWAVGLALAALLAAAIALLLSSGLGRASRSTQPAKAFAAHLNAGASGLAAARSLRSLPVSAQATISRTLGAHQQKFLAQSAGLGYRMAAGGVRADFAPSGVRLGAAGGSVSVRLAGIGHGADLRPLAAVAPRARANLVRYEGEALTAGMRVVRSVSSRASRSPVVRAAAKGR